MVGVPTSRGCTACRKQKKKCISNDQVPPCERCQRLGIPCLELGQRRLKFQSENDKLAILVRKNDQVGSSSQVMRFASIKECNVVANSSSIDPQHRLLIRLPPSSGLTRLRAGYIRIVDGSVDISVHLPWNYGPYLEQVPLYLGRSEAFDASAQALIACYSCLRRNTRPGADAHALDKYSEALRALAKALNDPEEATSTETLGSISMLIVFEAIAGFGANSVLAHAGGAAKVYKQRGRTIPRNEFEALLQLSLRGAIVMQALYLPSTYFTEEEWTGLTESQIGADSAEEKAFRCFAIYARLFHTANTLFDRQEDHEDEVLQFRALMLDSETLKDRLIPELNSLRKTFWNLTSSLKSMGNSLMSRDPTVGKSIWNLNTYHAHIGRSYGFAIATEVLINSLIQATGKRLDSCIPLTSGTNWNKNQSLAMENTDLAREACKFAKEVDKYRPLGTQYMARVLQIISIGATGMVSDPIEAISTQSSSNTLLSAGTGHVVHQDEDNAIQFVRLDDLIRCGKGNEINNNKMTVEEELSLLVTRYSSDFGEVLSAKAIKQASEWLKKKFTFEKTLLSSDAAPFSEIESNS